VKSHHPRAFMEQPFSSMKAFDDCHSPHPNKTIFFFSRFVIHFVPGFCCHFIFRNF
jgi:hypothetical protein